MVYTSITLNHHVQRILPLGYILSELIFTAGGMFRMNSFFMDMGWFSWAGGRGSFMWIVGLPISPPFAMCTSNRDMAFSLSILDTLSFTLNLSYLNQEITGHRKLFANNCCNTNLAVSKQGCAHAWQPAQLH